MNDRQIAEREYKIWEQAVEKAMDLCVSDENGLPTEQIPDEIDLSLAVHKAIMAERTCEWKKQNNPVEGIKDFYTITWLSNCNKKVINNVWRQRANFCPDCGKRIVEPKESDV